MKIHILRLILQIPHFDRHRSQLVIGINQGTIIYAVPRPSLHVFANWDHYQKICVATLEQLHVSHIIIKRSSIEYRSMLNL